MTRAQYVVRTLVRAAFWLLVGLVLVLLLTCDWASLPVWGVLSTIALLWAATITMFVLDGRK